MSITKPAVTTYDADFTGLCGSAQLFSDEATLSGSDNSSDYQLAAYTEGSNARNAARRLTSDRSMRHDAAASMMDRGFMRVALNSSSPKRSSRTTTTGMPSNSTTTNSTGSTTTIFSVWDGDWALLEEYSFNGSTSTILQKYVQGYHGLVKTLVDNVYYYQDELGSTSHIANASGALLEYYKYNLYGKPSYFSSTSQQLNSSTYSVVDLGNGGSRWMPELGLYDDRNRFMSPDLGRFLQPDPIGFKGDASNLYRYCGNDWANRVDPTGLEEVDVVFRAFISQPYVGWGRFSLAGDNRTFSGDAHASSRTSVAVRIETDPSKNHGHPMIGMPTIQISPSHNNLTGGEKTATGPQLPRVSVTQGKDGTVGIHIDQNVRTPYQPAGKGIRANVDISVNQQATKGTVQGTLSRSPAFEANFTPENGKTRNLQLQDGPRKTIPFLQGLQDTAPVDKSTQISPGQSEASHVEPVDIGGTGFANLGGLFFGGNGPPTGGPP
jgi:RHS repeat-associated protein